MKYLVTLFLLFIIGCARFPQGSSDQRETKIKFSFTVEGKINKEYIYIVALSVNKKLGPIQENGPLPIVDLPWGNGFVGGECTHYVEWKPYSTPPFQLYRFIDKDLETKQYIGGLTTFNPIEQNSTRTISFELTLGQLAQGSAITAEEIKSLKVNFLTMNLIPLTTGDHKIGDSLGGPDPTQRAWITVPLNANMVYDNAYYGSKKPSGNIPDPDIKIVDFSVEVNNSE